MLWTQCQAPCGPNEVCCPDGTCIPPGGGECCGAVHCESDKRCCRGECISQNKCCDDLDCGLTNDQKCCPDGTSPNMLGYVDPQLVYLT